MVKRSPFASVPPSLCLCFAFSSGPRLCSWKLSGSGQMMMRVDEGEDWREVQPFWTVDHSLCWGSVCATGDVPLE